MNEPVLRPIEATPLDERTIHAIVQRIVAAFHPRRIILFGSRAWGEPRSDSDLDLFVEMETPDPPLERRVKIRRLFRPSPCAMDILVYTPAEVAERRRSLASLVPVIEQEGRVLYEQSV
ncbi:MAG: nucleotidyltransferase domain-containing protein [Verrucomicrobia bacterium]|nr:nucleotidyltransferase domain-containing protein [Verrucomicrobiota bacterium]